MEKGRGRRPDGRCCRSEGLNEGGLADSLRRRGKTIKIFDVDAGDKRPVVPRHRAPSYPYHNYERNSGAPKLAGMIFRLPIAPAWKGKNVEFRVMMFGDGADGARAEPRLVTPKPVLVPVPLRVGPAPFRLFQPNLARGDPLIFHPGRGDEAKSVRPDSTFDPFPGPVL